MPLSIKSKRRRPGLCIGLTLAGLVAVQEPVHSADLEKGRRVFQTCASCHSVTSEANGFGPYLKGVVGRRAGSAAGFNYSQAMRDAGSGGLTWDEKALAEFLSSPEKKFRVPRCASFGLWFQSEIDDVIAYLKSNP